MEYYSTAVCSYGSNLYSRLIYAVAILLIALQCSAQHEHELNKNWQCINIQKVAAGGEAISQPNYALNGTMPATVPGTVLTTMLNNHLVPDPFYGMNNLHIPDIYDAGNAYYTYWFINDFTEQRPAAGKQVWLHLRGVNYSCNVYLNGHLLNDSLHQGMFLRQTYNISKYLTANGHNRLAIIVYPPDPAGNANGGQGGDGMIAKNITTQYTAGWDWIQPIRDRNTGIWDKITIERTGTVNIADPHVVTLVPGKRMPDGMQPPAIVKMAATLQNTANTAVTGTLKYELGNKVISRKVTLAGLSTKQVQLPDDTLRQPQLWWPNGYGAQPLYQVQLQFVTASQKEDEEAVSFGVREITTRWNTETKSREILVNGQKIFIKGGNWIASDAMLRLSPERYDAEVRFHRDMNLNLIRVWGGSITERPEFYNACDKYGMLVFQDFWNSGDCNGKWQDPKKKEDQWTRRQYPDDHSLFLISVADQVKMLRNHPSLALWCGGNEITPPQDILQAMKDSIMPALDGTRYLFDYSNSDSMSYNFLGGNGDGPYGIQPVETFFTRQTFPFNSEVGSVGVGDYESLKRFIPAENMKVPVEKSAENGGDSVWNYHKYSGYRQTVDAYGKPKDVADFSAKAQLVNYDQYRALAEGFSAHMWQWYTGFIIWKTQNPWTALRGQMYDYYLDPNACLYGLHSGSEPLHVMYNPADGMIMVANNTFTTQHDLMLQIRTVDMQGHDTLRSQAFFEAGASLVQKYSSIKRMMDRLREKEGVFLSLRLLNLQREIVSDNLYWLPDSTGAYSGLQHIPAAQAAIQARQVADSSIEVTITNPAVAPVAFFNRLSLVQADTKERILPVFYSDNYVSVLPGETKKVQLSYTPAGNQKLLLSAQGWNLKEQYIDILP